jgi:multidrug efflux pump subunit AcrA (membrane-fusion protein)
MKKFLLAAAALTAVAVAFVVITRVSAKQAEGSLPQGAEVVRVTRRDIASVVKATGVIKPMVGAEVRVGSSASGGTFK